MNNKQVPEEIKEKIKNRATAETNVIWNKNSNPKEWEEANEDFIQAAEYGYSLAPLPAEPSTPETKDKPATGAGGGGEGILDKHLQSLISNNPSQYHSLETAKEQPEYKIILAAMEEYATLRQPTGTVDGLLRKYRKLANNIEWHIKTNKPLGAELTYCHQRIEAYREIIEDLEAIKGTANDWARKEINEWFSIHFKNLSKDEIDTICNEFNARYAGIIDEYTKLIRHDGKQVYVPVSTDELRNVSEIPNEWIASKEINSWLKPIQLPEREGVKRLGTLTDAEKLEVAKILGGASHISEENQIIQVDELLKNRYSGQTNIPGIGWYRAWKYLESCGYEIDGLNV